MQSINDECPICLEELDAVKNRANTECGHCFHTTCLIKHSVLTNIACPLCRTDLADIPEEEYESSDDDSDEDDDSDDDSGATTTSDNSQEVVPRRTITQILSVMAQQNITNRHLVSALITITYQEGWMNRYFVCNEEDDKEDEIMNILDNISTLPVDHRDTRRYAEVLMNVPAVAEAGAGPGAI